MDISESSVEYRNIPDFPGYRVGTDGSVWSSKPWRQHHGESWHRLAVFTNVNGYRVVSLWHANRRILKLIHVLMLEAFVSPRPLWMWGLHKNDNRLDNRLDNLYWGNKATNIEDAKANKRLYGPGFLLTKGEVIAIRLLAEQGVSQTEIGRRLGLGLGTIRSIISGRTRKDVS